MNQFHLYKSFAWLFRFVLQRRTFNFHLFQEMRIATRRQAQPTWHMVFKKRNFRMGMSFASWESDVASARELRAPTPSPSAMRVSVGRKGILRICTWGLRCTNERGGGTLCGCACCVRIDDPASSQPNRPGSKSQCCHQFCVSMFSKLHQHCYAQLLHQVIEDGPL